MIEIIITTHIRLYYRIPVCAIKKIKTNIQISQKIKKKRKKK